MNYTWFIAAKVTLRFVRAAKFREDAQAVVALMEEVGYFRFVFKR